LKTIIFLAFILVASARISADSMDTIARWRPSCTECLVSSDMKSFVARYGSRTLYDIQDLE
jgi:hypothetical protein